MKKWNELSMADRAKYIKLGVEQGITDIKHISSAYNSYAGGGYKGDENNPIILPEQVVTPRVNYTHYTGEETDRPSVNEYIRSRMDEARADAVIGMLNTKTPAIPKVPTQIGRVLNKYTGGIIPANVLGYDKYPFTCIYTATTPYGETHAVPGNMTLAQNPFKYGFEYTDEPKEGDIVQLWDVDDTNKSYPWHAGMITGFNSKGHPTISQSHGGIDPEDMAYDADYWLDDFGLYNGEEGMRYLTFTGTKNDRDKWRKEYKSLYSTKANRFDEGGHKTILGSFRDSLIPIPINEFIRNNYGYRPYRLSKEIEDTVPVRNNKAASVKSKDNTANNIPSTKEEPDSVEVNVSKPGTYFPREWKDKPKSTIDSSGNYHTDLPDVYRIDDRPLTFGDRLYRAVNSVMDANPITSSTRVKNMQKADMKNYWDISPRQTASGLSTIGNFLTYVPEPRIKAAGYVLQAPDLIYDSTDAVLNPSWKNTASVLGDVAGIDKLTKYVKPFKLPSFNIPTYTFTDGEGNRLFSLPGGTIGGQTINPMYFINLLKGYGIVEDALNTFGLDFPTFEKAEDPDTIRIHQTPQGGYGEYIHTPWEEFNKNKDEK